MIGKPLINYIPKSERSAFRSQLNWLYQVERVQDWEVRLMPRRGVPFDAVLTLIEDLLDISRIIRGRVRLFARPTNLVHAIEAAIDTVRPTAVAKTIQISSWLDDPEVSLVSGDPDRLQQVVWNLLSNAIKFTPVGGRVEVKLTSVNSHAQIQVTDTGQGISPDFLPYVFERFRQAESTTTRAHGGLGLGLAIVRNLVELHGES